MLILIAIVLVSIGIAFIISIYSIVNPFVNNLGDIRNYNIAYYGAISSVERGKLALKYHKSGFEGSGGWIGNTTIGPASDLIGSGFSLLNAKNNGMWYDIQSTLSGGVIPQAGNSNIDMELRGADSSNYNKLEYGLSEEFLLDIDNTTDPAKYYTGDITRISSNSVMGANSVISGSIRLPPKVLSSFSNSQLCEICDSDGDGVANDIIVGRSMFGNYNGQNFTIMPTMDVSYGSTPTVNSSDSNIREDVVNRGNFNMLFSNSRNPINGLLRTDPLVFNVIPPNFDLTGKNFQNTSIPYGIFNDSNITGLHLKLSMVNLMKNSNGQIFPFLEYKFQIKDGLGNPIKIPDRFFNISGNSKVGKYNVQIKLKTPVTSTDSSSDFAILF